MPAALPVFYPDLSDERFASSLAVYHQRFSTNTWPQWRLAQPFRYLAHNGEINTMQANRNWSLARERKFATPLLPNMDDVRPIVATNGSDSHSLDNMLEGLVMGGAGLFRSAAPADAAGLAERAVDGRRPARLLRIQLHAHGAVGRPGRRGADRRPLRRVPAGSQRPAPGALRDHQRPPLHHRLGNRRVGLRAGGRGAEGPHQAGPDDRGRPGNRQASCCPRTSTAQLKSAHPTASG